MRILVSAVASMLLVAGGASALPESGSGLDDGEFMVDTNITPVPAPSTQRHSAVAFDGTNHLVVWADDRTSGDRDIYFARVSQAGELLDPIGKALADAARDQGMPAVAFGGSCFLVVWEDERSGTEADIFGARVTPDGAVLDPGGIAIATVPGEQWLPDVTYDGVSFLVVWMDGRNDNYICGARVTPGGTVLDPDGIVIVSGVGYRATPAVASDGTNCLAVWGDARNANHDIYGARLSRDGTVLDPDGIPVALGPAAQSEPDVAFDGANFVVAWWHIDDDHEDIYCARVARAGTVLDTSGIAVVTVESPEQRPSVVCDGMNALVLWEDTRDANLDIYGARLNREGTVLDPDGIAIRTEGHRERPNAAFDGTNYLIVWACDDISGARVRPDLVVLDTVDRLVSTAANHQQLPAVVFNGTDYLVVWEDGDGTDDVQGTRVTPGGAVLDPGGISVAATPGRQASPAVASDGADFLVVWEDWRAGWSDVYGTRVTREGVVLESLGIPISAAAGGQGMPAVGFGGGSYLVVWADQRNGDTSDIYCARVSPDGTVLDPDGIVISSAPHHQTNPSLAFDGTNYLVVWPDLRHGRDYYLYAARVSPDGTVLDTGGIPISISGGARGSPVAAFDGANYLIVWEDYRRGGEGDIFGSRVTPDGRILEPAVIVVSGAAGQQATPGIVFDGSGFLVAWQDWRAGPSDILGARVSSAGIVLDSGRFAGQNRNQWTPILAHGPGSQTLLVYSGWAGTVGGKGYHANRIWGKFGPFPGVGEESQQPLANSQRSFATIVRGVLTLPASSVRRDALCALLDISGRKVLDLHPGPNDVSRLAPGVYFVREQSVVSSQQTGPVRKMVITD